MVLINTFKIKGSNAAGTPTATVQPGQPTRQTIITPSGQRVILMGTQPGQKQIVTVPGATTMTPVSGTTMTPVSGTSSVTGTPIQLPQQLTQQLTQQATPTQQQPQLLQQQQQPVPVQQLPQPATSLLMSSLTSPPKTNSPRGSPQKQATPIPGPPGALKSPDKFELTTDYIQQTIQQALRKDNLSPEIEQKLLALQQHNQDHDPPPVS